MRLVLLFIAMIFCLPANARQAEIEVDSLEVYMQRASAFNQAGDYGSAIPLFEKCRAIIKQKDGTEDKIYNDLAFLIGSGYYNLQNYPQAAKYLSEYEAYCKGFQKEQFAKVESTLAAILGQCYFHAKNYERALHYLERTMALFKNQSNAIDVYCATIPAAMNSCGELGLYDKALKMAQDADAHFKTLLGPNDPKYRQLRSMISLGYTLIDMADKAMEYANDNSDNQTQSNDSTAIQILSFEALSHINGQSYDLAVQKIDKALDICRNSYGEIHKSYAELLQLKSLCYFKLNDYEQAVGFGRQSVGIFEKLGTNNKETNNKEYIQACTSLIELLSVVDARKHEIEIKKCVAQVFTILGGLDVSLYLQEWIELSEACVTFLVEIEDYKNAIAHYKNLHNYYKTYKAGSFDYTQNLIGMASTMFIADEDVSHLIPEIEKIHNDIGAFNGNKAQTTRKTSSGILFDYYYFSGQYENAKKYAIEYSDLTDEEILQSFRFLSAKERSALMQQSEWLYYQRIPYLCLKLKDSPEMAECAYDGQLMSKNMLLSTDKSLKELLLNSGDKAVLDQYDALLATQLQLNGLYESGADADAAAIDSLEQAALAQEKVLIQSSKVYGDYTQNLRINWKDVQKKLGEHDIAIEFFNVEIGGSSTYGALTLTRDDAAPQVVSLFDKFILEMCERHGGYYQNEMLFSKALLEPLEGRLAGKRNIYFAPAGELHNIAIECIPHWGDPNSLLSDHWNFYRLSSTRELALIKDYKTAEEATIYGGLMYSADVNALVANDRQYRTRDFFKDDMNIADSLNLRAGVQYLPATKTEAHDIDAILRQKNIRTTLFTDTAGTEASFKAISASRSGILHVATHGFYLSSQQAKSSGNLSFMRSANSLGASKQVEDHELSRSGLILAGADNALKGRPLPDDIDDGILTAKEIASLNLGNFDLVTLSACQTGLGDIKGDGVFGLQRGFKKAGVNTLLMSLWKVDDNATKMLMTRFYENLTKGKTKLEALKEAQRYVRDYVELVEVKKGNRRPISARQKAQLQAEENAKEKEYKEVRKYEDPKFWAGFILLDAIK